MISWEISLIILLFKLLSFLFKNLNLIFGPFVELELIFSLKNFLNSIGCSNLYYTNCLNLCGDTRLNFLFSNTFLSLGKVLFYFIFALNLRLELPLLLIRIRKFFFLQDQNLLFFSFGLNVKFLGDLVNVKNLGNSVLSIKNFFEGKFKSISNFFLQN